MRALAVLLGLALACGCDDAAPESPVDGATLDSAVHDQGSDMPTLDMAIAADQGPDAHRADMSSRLDAALLEDVGVDARLADALPADAAPDMAAPGCLATVIVNDFEIFQYEASRVDATAEASGEDATGVCSRAGVLPWVNVDLESARAACATVGFSVCTGAQWQQACVGPELWAYPYGPEHAPGTCNDHVAGSGALEVCGARPECVGPTGIHDQNGNVWELTDDGQRRGASYKLTASMFRPEAGSCEAGFVVADGFFGRDIGFRCCR